MSAPLIIESLDDLLRAARAQDQPQQLLVVFAGAPSGRLTPAPYSARSSTPARAAKAASLRR
jgi:hypothetical protein